MQQKRSNLDRIRQLLYDAEFAHNVYGDEATLRMYRTIQKVYTQFIAAEQKKSCNKNSIAQPVGRKIIPFRVNTSTDFDRALSLI